MYNAYFGLRESPFNLTPDPRYLFLSRQHSEALSHLLYGIIERKGFIVLTGGIGAGKTTVIRALLARLDESVETALLFNPALSELELLDAILQEFGIPPGRGRKTRKRLIDALNRFLLAAHGEGKAAVLIIDEAHNLAHPVLEQIRLLSNLETEQDKLLQIVLVGQPELAGFLASPSLRQLNERVMVRCDLRPLTRDQVGQYIDHRLAVAGMNGAAVEITAGALRKVYAYSRGIPRRINSLCDRALLGAYSRNTKRIDGAVVTAAARDLGGPMALLAGGSFFSLRSAVVASAVVLAALAVMFVVFHRTVVGAILTCLKGS
ncbi:MAG: AAA family ATPase [Deltaproteobacteria bacterium]|nr:AAA family ATPase [Deltaproteobacteria bacterium]